MVLFSEVKVKGPLPLGTSWEVCYIKYRVKGRSSEVKDGKIRFKPRRLPESDPHRYTQEVGRGVLWLNSVRNPNTVSRDTVTSVYLSSGLLGCTCPYFSRNPDRVFDKRSDVRPLTSIVVPTRADTDNILYYYHFRSIGNVCLTWVHLLKDLLFRVTENFGKTNPVVKLTSDGNFSRRHFGDLRSISYDL